MDKSQVIKVKYNGSMCRITAAKVANENVMSYAALEDRIRSSFKLSPADVISLTYTDIDGDVVNLSSDQDVADALLYQQLNPLRVELQVEKGPDTAASVASLTTSASFSSQASHSSAASQSASKTGKSEDVTTSPAEQKPAVENLTELLEQQLRSVLTCVESGEVVKNLEPLLKEAPAKIAEVLEAALKGGLSVSFTPILESDDGSSTNSGDTLHVHAVNVEAATKGAVNTDGAGSVAVAAAPVNDGLKGLLEPVAAVPPKLSTSSAKPAIAVSTPMAPRVAGTVAGAATPPVVHKGIICDECDMNPIVGLRYKSLVKHDYDLCEGCYKVANAGPREYKCYDTPVFRPAHRQGPPAFNGGPPAFRGVSWTAPNQAAGRPRWAPPQSAAFGNRSCSVRPFPADMKLEARFVNDVTIPDAMEMLPGTRFTKIWKMRNTGTIPWPQFTQIVHIGGDSLGERTAVLLQMPEGGVQPDQDVDVSVDMVAPARIGRYMTHWRLCAPGGPKFGHRVWALIQVVSPEKFPSGAAPAFFTPVAAPAAVPTTPVADKLPSQETVTAAAAAPTVEEYATTLAVEAGANAPMEVEAVVDPIIAAVLSAVPPTPEIEGKDEMKEAVPGKTEEVQPAEEKNNAAVAEGYVEVVDFKSVEPASAAPVVPSAPPLPTAPSVESTDVGSFSLVDAVPVKAVGSASISDAAAADGYVDAGVALPENSAPNGEAVKKVDLGAAAREKMFLIEDEEESEALDQLEGMGFEDRELNREALKAAKGRVVEAMDALMKTAEWDPILSELEEMGFEDKMLNKRMMFKNSGNVKGAVKDIVHFYKNQ